MQRVPPAGRRSSGNPESVCGSQGRSARAAGTGVGTARARDPTGTRVTINAEPAELAERIGSACSASSAFHALARSGRGRDPRDGDRPPVPRRPARGPGPVDRDSRRVDRVWRSGAGGGGRAARRRRALHQGDHGYRADYEDRTERARPGHSRNAAEEPRRDRSGDQREPRGAAHAARERTGAGKPGRELQGEDRAAAGHGGAHQRNAEGQRRGGGADRLRTQTKRRLIMRRIFSFLTIVVVLDACPVAAQGPDEARIVVRDVVKTVTSRASQGRTRNNGPEQTETFSRKVKVGRDGRVSISNVAGDIKITGGSGDDVTIEAIKRTRGDRSQLAEVQITVDDRPGRVEVRTEYPNNWGSRNRNIDVSVDYTVVVPATATVDVKSISGSVIVTGVQGAVRAESISGTVRTSATPKLTAKTVSGDLELVSAPPDADITATTISGTVRAKGLKLRSLDLGSVSGDLSITDIAC